MMHETLFRVTNPRAVDHGLSTVADIEVYPHETVTLFVDPSKLSSIGGAHYVSLPATLKTANIYVVESPAEGYMHIHKDQTYAGGLE